MLENRILDGYECRTESTFKIADALGITYERGKKNKQVDKIYRDLALIFKGDDSLPVGTGKTGRLRQAPVSKLYTFARNQYNAEITQWNATQSSKSIDNNKDNTASIVLITSFLNKLDEGSMIADEFIGAVRGIIASHNMIQDKTKR